MITGKRSQAEPRGSYWKAHLGDWAKYTAAAGAALSMATGADAGIVSGNPDKTISLANPGNPGSPGTRKATQFGLFSAAIGLSGSSRGFNNSGSYRLGAARVGGINIFGAAGCPPVVACPPQFVLAGRFASGQSIGGNHLGALAGLLSADINTRGFGFNKQGNFNFNTTGIVGFTVLGGDLGWMKVKVGDTNGDRFPDQLTIISWAYNTTPGAAITAGQTPASSPEPGTAALGLLAAGAAGILALRRRRKEVQSN